MYKVYYKGVGYDEVITLDLGMGVIRVGKAGTRYTFARKWQIASKEFRARTRTWAGVTYSKSETAGITQHVFRITDDQNNTDVLVLESTPRHDALAVRQIAIAQDEGLFRDEAIPAARA